ncbi:hypothetical protein [Piscinibacter sp.]|uniref:hypothetical protein n=1 Tax=Piscinibacter sp. TaxID=1903157 RepID=UPI002F418F55
MWLLAAAIPAQGFAAVTVHRCDANHHQRTAAAAALVHADSVAHQHASHHRAAATASDAQEGDDSAQPVKAKDGVQASSKGSCSLCASCCTAAALPATIVAFDAPMFVESLCAAAVGGVAPFLTDGPERPPRPVLA